MNPPCKENNFLGHHAQLLISSYYHLLGEQLIAVSDPQGTPYRTLYEAPFAVVSHGTEPDPIFNYANRCALLLFEMNWKEFTRLPSRKSAEAMKREERQQLLDRVSRQGFIDNYRGVRISASGSRFRIENAIVWNLVDDRGIYRGQAACFHQWFPIQD